MNEMYPIIEVSPSELHRASYQPVSRTEINGALEALQKSIKQDGLQYPPLVVRRADGDGYDIVDGHRRVRVANDLKWPRIPVIVSSQGDARRLFAAVSGASKPLSAVEWMEVYLGGGELPPGPTATCIRRIDAEMGREFLAELLQKKISPAIWNFGAKVLKYVGLSEDEKPSMLRWLAKHRLGQSVQAAIKMDLPASTILTAFRGDLAVL
jgi:hypothetical protein